MTRQHPRRPSCVRVLEGMALLLMATTPMHADTLPADDRMARLLAQPADLVAATRQAPMARYNRLLKGGAHTDAAFSAGWQVPLALAAWCGNSDADDRLVEQVRFVLQPGHEPTANGGYPSQHERCVTGMFAILRKCPRVWFAKLTPEQRHKIDLIMKATLVASAYTTADATYAEGRQPTTLDGDANLHRGWNPNYREGMFGGLIVGTVYFGGVDAARVLLERYDHALFVSELRAAGLRNIAETFAWGRTRPRSGAPKPEQIERSVCNYRLDGHVLPEPYALYATLTRHTYGAKVNAGLADGRGILVDGEPTGCLAAGADQLPNVGKEGMLREFDSTDADGPRSSIVYAYDGFRPNLIHHVVLLVGGFWPADGSDAELLARLDVGVTDLAYKLRHGYRNYAKGKGSKDLFDIGREDWVWSFRTLLPLWTDVLRPYHLTRRRP